MTRTKTSRPLGWAPSKEWGFAWRSAAAYPLTLPVGGVRIANKKSRLPSRRSRPQREHDGGTQLPGIEGRRRDTPPFAPSAPLPRLLQSALSTHSGWQPARRGPRPRGRDDGELHGQEAEFLVHVPSQGQLRYEFPSTTGSVIIGPGVRQRNSRQRTRYGRAACRRSPSSSSGTRCRSTGTHLVHDLQVGVALEPAGDVLAQLFAFLRLRRRKHLDASEHAVAYPTRRNPPASPLFRFLAFLPPRPNPPMLIDLHVHSYLSRDCPLDPRAVLASAPRPSGSTGWPSPRPTPRTAVTSCSTGKRTRS